MAITVSIEIEEIGDYIALKNPASYRTVASQNAPENMQVRESVLMATTVEPIVDSGGSATRTHGTNPTLQLVSTEALVRDDCFRALSSGALADPRYDSRKQLMAVRGSHAACKAGQFKHATQGWHSGR